LKRLPPVLVVGLGGGPLGNYQRAITDDEAVSTVDAEWTAGIRYFDTAPYYGAGRAGRRTRRTQRLAALRDEGVVSAIGVGMGDAAMLTRVVELCRKHDVPVPAAAMRFPLTHPAVAGIVIGCHTPDQVRANLTAFAHPIPPKLWAELS
jgi:aryl-alcohol dehydrogenase-like predicted oxidoreductase